MENILRELIQDQLREDKMMPHDEEAMNRIVDEAYCMAENRDLATTLDTIVGMALNVHKDSLMPVRELRHARRNRPLNKLSVQDYVDDYNLYLEHCDDPNQRNLHTYFLEFEHQEGEIAAWKKGVVASRITSQLLEPLRKAQGEIEQQVFGWVKQCVEHKGPYYEELMPMHHEGLQEYIQDYIEAIKRGIEKFGGV